MRRRGAVVGGAMNRAPTLRADCLAMPRRSSTRPPRDEPASAEPAPGDVSPGALPPHFLDRLARIVPPARFDAVLATFEAPPDRVGFRVNPLRGTRAAVLDALATTGLDVAPVAWYADAFTVPHAQRAALLATDAARIGAVYLQNLASMVPPLALAPEAGERILDLAAAPGSKTLQLAALAGQGTPGEPTEIAAVEIVRERFFRLRANLASGGAAWVRTYLQDGTKAARYRPDHFDRVLLDAPCSTEGRFRADDPETTRYWSERKVREMQHRQRRLAEAAAGALRVGGVMVYATCSLAPEENETIIDGLLTRFEGALELEPIPVAGPLDGGPPFAAALGGWDGEAFAHDLSHTRRILPDGTHEAFFVARIRKVDDTE